MNIIPLELQEDKMRRDCTFGMVVQNLAIEAEHVIHVNGSPLEFLGESL